MKTAQSTQLVRAIGETATQFIETDSADEVLKVSTRSRPSAVAGAIAGVIRENGMAEVQSAHPLRRFEGTCESGDGDTRRVGSQNPPFR